MNTLIIILTQSRSAALLEILLLLIVAGLIGYITSYLYYKSIYTKQITKIESEKSDLLNQIVSLKHKQEELEIQLNEKINEINQLKG